MQEIQNDSCAETAPEALHSKYDEGGRIKDIFFKVRLHEKELRCPTAFRNLIMSDAAVFAGMQYDVHQMYDRIRMKKAEAIAWRICKSWLEAQITLINLEQAKLEEL